jgi:hypothetical protein
LQLTGSGIITCTGQLISSKLHQLLNLLISDVDKMRKSNRWNIFVIKIVVDKKREVGDNNPIQNNGGNSNAG